MLGIAGQRWPLSCDQPPEALTCPGLSEFGCGRVACVLAVSSLSSKDVHDGLIDPQRMEKRGRRWLYQAEFLVQVLLVAGQSRTARIKEVLRRALAVALPACFSHHFTSALDGKSVVPSPSTIYRHRLTLHVGWMLSERAERSKALSEGDFVRSPASGSKDE